jgi:hypothetical protein
MEGNGTVPNKTAEKLAQNSWCYDGDNIWQSLEIEKRFFFSVVYLSLGSRCSPERVLKHPQPTLVS